MSSEARKALLDESEDELPRAFSRFVLFDHIGRGGMANIYLARMRNALGGHRYCVIKEVLPLFSDDPTFSEMLTAEAKLAARLNHGNIVQVFDLGRETREDGSDGRLFLAMDYVEGFDLNELLKRLSKARIALPAEFALTVVIETLRGLDYAHRHRDDDGIRMGLVHRDVSPSNVLISFEGEVKLCDFGIARAMRHETEGLEGSDEAQVRRTRLVGKAAYMAPEHARGEDIDARADVFAAGILLWELASGRRLYKGDDLLALARAGDAPPLRDRGMPGHDALAAIVARALEVDRDKRYHSAGDFLEALEGYAIEHRLMASPLKFGAFLTDHFADEIVSRRRERERAAALIEGDVDPANFGPSSAPPPAGEMPEITIPSAASVPLEALRLAGAELLPEATVPEDDGNDTPDLTEPEVRLPEARDSESSSPEAPTPDASLADATPVGASLGGDPLVGDASLATIEEPRAGDDADSWDEAGDSADDLSTATEDHEEFAGDATQEIDRSDAMTDVLSADALPLVAAAAETDEAPTTRRIGDVVAANVMDDEASTADTIAVDAVEVPEAAGSTPWFRRPTVLVAIAVIIGLLMIVASAVTR